MHHMSDYGMESNTQYIINVYIILSEYRKQELYKLKVKYRRYGVGISLLRSVGKGKMQESKYNREKEVR